MDEDPVRLVVKNTFIDVDQEEGHVVNGPEFNRRSSDTGVNYGLATRGMADPTAMGGSQKDIGFFDDDRGREGTFIDDVMDVPHAAPSRKGLGKQQVDKTPGPASNRNRQTGRHGRGGGGSSRHSTGIEHQFFGDDIYMRGYGGGHHDKRRTSLQSVMTENSPTGGMFVPGAMGYPGHPQSPMGMGAMTGNAFGMPPPGGMYPQPWMMPPYMPMPGWPGPPMPGMGMPPGYGMPGMGVPPAFGDAGGGKGPGGGHARTTVMLRNLPPEYKRDMVVELLNREGFERLFDFVYMPMNLRTMASFGYVFVNFTSPIVADQCRSVFQGLTRWAIESDKVCDVLWSDEQQGLSSNIERYRNSPVMHESVPEECKPIVLANGQRAPFPAPTKRLREPRIRRPQATDGKGAPPDDSG